MPRVYRRRSYPEPKTQVLPVRGWPRGLDTLVNPNQIRTDELAEAVNVAYSQYGVLSKRSGTSLVTTLPARVQGFGVFNRRDTTTGAITKYFCAVAGGIFYTIDPIAHSSTVRTGATFNATNRIVMRQGENALYIFDGEHPLTKWTGSAFVTFTPITKPTGLAITKTGTGTGTKTFSYIVTASNAAGETDGTTAVQLTAMPAKLDTSTYSHLTWVASTGATAYNIYRGSPGNETYLTSVTETAFNDQGQADAAQSGLIIVPSQNTTTGPVMTTGTVYHQAIFGVDKDNPSILWYSAGGDKIDSFAPNDGGGFLTFHPETGEGINGVEVFAGLGSDALYIHQDHKLGQFKFGADGQPQVSDVNLSVGGISDAAIVLFENDMALWTRYGLYTLRQEPNFVNVLRISELSIRVHPTYVNTLTQSALAKVCGIYDKANHVLVFSIPNGASENNTSLAYDPVYLSFSEYRGIAATAFSRFTDGANGEATYGGDKQGRIFRLFDGTADLDQPIYFRAATKVFDMEAPYAYKYFLKTFLFFGNINAQRLQVSLVQDGVTALKNFAIATDLGRTGWGADRWGDLLWGDSSTNPVAVNTRSVLRYVDINRDLFSLQVVYENTSAYDSFEILALFFLWQASDKPLGPSLRIA